MCRTLALITISRSSSTRRYAATEYSYAIAGRMSRANTPTVCEESEWWQVALTGNDQLRQRVAFALSEIFVISSDSDNATTITYYHNMLAQDAFTNFATIMHDVTVSPGMGAYLNMLNSAKAPTGQIANENYARELMQLFTIGIDQLNPDGTLQLDGSGNPIPNYTEAQVQAFARAYTGWTYATATGGSPTNFPTKPRTTSRPWPRSSQSMTRPRRPC